MILQPQQFIDLIQSSALVQYFFIGCLSSVTTLVLMNSSGANELKRASYFSNYKYNSAMKIADVVLAGLFWPVTITVAICYHVVKTSKS